MDDRAMRPMSDRRGAGRAVASNAASRRGAALAVQLALVLAGLSARAQSTQSSASTDGAQGAKAEPRKGRVVTISEVTIVGRIQKPIAAVDVSRIQPRLTLKELKQPFVHRVREAVFKDPF